MSWSFTLSPGGDITALVELQSIVRAVRLHTELRPNSNKLEFKCLFDSTLFAALLSAAFLGEVPHMYHAAAFGLIVGGIVVSARR